MKDYTDEDFDSKKGLFYDYLNIVKMTEQGLPNDINAGKYIVKLISSFGIESSASEFESFIKGIDNLKFFQKKYVLKCLEILGDLTTTQIKKPLSLKDLKSIVDTIRKNDPVSEDEVFYILADINIRDNKLADYFPAEYFVKQESAAISKELQEKIHAHFNIERSKDVISILANFTDKIDQKRYDETVDKLIRISGKLNDDEQRLLFSKLTDKQLYQDIRIESFLNLLNSISRCSSVDTFIYFMEQCKSYTESTKLAVEGVCQKASFYLDKILPGLNTIKNQKISKLDFLALSTDVLLYTGINELEMIHENRECEKDKQYLVQRNLLNEVSFDIKRKRDTNLF